MSVDNMKNDNSFVVYDGVMVGTIEQVLTILGLNNGQNINRQQLSEVIHKNAEIIFKINKQE